MRRFRQTVADPEAQALKAGPLGRKLMARFLELGWVTLDSKSRDVRLTEVGRTSVSEDLGAELPVP
jgi:hypothetical protein